MERLHPLRQAGAQERVPPFTTVEVGGTLVPPWKRQTDGLFIVVASSGHRFTAWAAGKRQPRRGVNRAPKGWIFNE